MIPYSDESLESRWYREHSIQIHKKRLKDIKARPKFMTGSPARFSSVNRKKAFKDQTELFRENMILYDKLTQISERKRSPTNIKGPKSLNIAIRKKEAERILLDNLEFVRRLTEKESFVPTKRLNHEYQLSEQYKKTISRANLHERLQKITKKVMKQTLPPIHKKSSQNNQEIFLDSAAENKPEFSLYSTNKSCDEKNKNFDAEIQKKKSDFINKILDDKKKDSQGFKKPLESNDKDPVLVHNPNIGSIDTYDKQNDKSFYKSNEVDSLLEKNKEKVENFKNFEDNKEVKNNKNDLYKDSKNIEENKEIEINEKNTNNIEENIEEKNLDNTEGLKIIKNPNFEDNLSLNDTSLHGEKNDLTAIKNPEDSADNNDHSS